MIWEVLLNSVFMPLLSTIDLISVNMAGINLTKDISLRSNGESLSIFSRLKELPRLMTMVSPTPTAKSTVLVLNSRPIRSSRLSTRFGTRDSPLISCSIKLNNVPPSSSQSGTKKKTSVLNFLDMQSSWSRKNTSTQKSHPLQVGSLSPMGAQTVSLARF